MDIHFIQYVYVKDAQMHEQKPGGYLGHAEPRYEIGLKGFMNPSVR